VGGANWISGGSCKNFSGTVFALHPWLELTFCSYSRLIWITEMHERLRQAWKTGDLVSVIVFGSRRKGRCSSRPPRIRA